MPKYKNKTEKDLTLIGIGVVKAGEVITQPDGFNNANFEKVAENESPEPEVETESKEEEEQQVDRRIKKTK